MKARVVHAVCAVVLAGCSSTGGVLGDLQEAVADVVLPPTEAAQLGDRLAQEVEAQEGLVPDAALQRRVSDIGHRLLAKAGAVPQPYRFTFKVVDEPQTVNAFALPGGRIYVTSGMTRMVDNDAQLAAVVGHEIAHVTQRHVAERLGAQYGLQMLASAALGQDPGAIAGLVSSVVQQGFLLKYSRDQELEADRVGLSYLRGAGYDPHAAIAVFRKLQAQESGGQPPVFLSSHPPTEQRIERLQELVARAR